MIPRAILTLALLVLACAGPKPAPAAPRISDSLPEQGAALRAADPRLKSEDEEQRWGIEGGRQRKREREQAAAYTDDATTRKAVIPMPPPNDSGVFGRADGGAG